MTPDEIRACYRLYPFLLRVHTGLEVLARDIGHGDPNGDLRPALAGPVGRLVKTLASFGAQLFDRGALVGR
jgi:hypothetical protein